MIYFVTQNWLQTNGIITDNTDVTDYSPLVQNAAKAFIKKQIGSYFFNDLLTKYNSGTLSLDEEMVVEIMQFAIGWRVCAEAGITLTYQLKNKGYQKQNDDNSVEVELKEATFLFDHYIQKALLFEFELKDFLTDNKADYPQFEDPLNKDSSIKKSICGDGGEYNEGVGFFVI